MAMEIFATGVKNPEGPVSLKDGSWLITEMDIGAVTQVSADGKTRQIVAESPLPNGITTDSSGNIWIADARARALLRARAGGNVETVSRGSEPDPFLLPNDLCFGPDGMIYMTDSGILHEDFGAVSQIDAYGLPFDGRLYRIDPKTGESEVLDRGFRLTNGIAIGPSGEYLYIAETMTANIYRYKFGVWKREYFGNVTVKPPVEFGRIAGPDGMAFDAAGNLYVTVLVQGDITVLDAGGNVSRRIPLSGTNPTNVAFDVCGKNRMMVTESSRSELVFIDTPLPGLELYG